jgi:predicted GTPase
VSLTYADMRENARQVADGFERLAGLIGDQPALATSVTHLRERAAKIRNDRFVIAVVGEFKRGKSTIVNALIGERVLPMKVTPCTAILTHIRYHEQKRVMVHFRDGRADGPLEPADFESKYALTIDDIEYASGDEANLSKLEAQYNQAIEDRFGDIDHAEFLWPLELARDGVELVDSPGLEEHPAREQRVIDLLRHADVVIMVLEAVPQFLNQRERRFITQRLKPLGLERRMFCVINRWNMILESLLDPEDAREREQAVAQIEQQIDLNLLPLLGADAGHDPRSRVFRLDGLGALRARMRGGDGATLAATGMPALEAALLAYLGEGRYAARKASDRALLEAVRDDVRKLGAIQLANADRPLQELLDRRRDMDRQLEKAQRAAQHIQSTIKSKGNELGDLLANSLENFIYDDLVPSLDPMVANLDLGPADEVFAFAHQLADVFRPQSSRFAAQIQAHVEPQVVHHFRAKLTEWKELAGLAIIEPKTRELRDELTVELAEYAEAISDAERMATNQQEGARSVNDIVKRWFTSLEGKDVKIGIGGVSFDLAPVVATVTADIALHGALHVSMPVIGFVVSAVLLFIRRERTRAQVRSKVRATIDDNINAFVLRQKDEIRKLLDLRFAEITTDISSRVAEELAFLDNSMRELIEEQRRSEQTAADLRSQHAAFADRAETEIGLLEELAR